MVVDFDVERIIVYFGKSLHPLQHMTPVRVISRLYTLLVSLNGMGVIL